MKNSFPLSLGLTVGAMAGLVHIVWSVLVAAGLAQKWIDFIANLHFMDSPMRLHAFDPGTAVMLVIVTSAVGFIFGYIFGTIWTKVRKA